MAQTRSSKSSGEQFEGARKLPRMCRVHGYVNNISLMQLRRGRRTGNRGKRHRMFARTSIRRRPGPCGVPGRRRRRPSRCASACRVALPLAGGRAIRSAIFYFHQRNSTYTRDATAPADPRPERRKRTHGTRRHTPN